MTETSESTGWRPACALRRCTAFGVDVLILAGLFLLVGTLPGFAVEYSVGWDRVGRLVEGVLRSMAFALPIAFTVVREALGRSIGHRLLKLSVRDVHGQPARRRQLLCRALLKYLPATLLLSIVILLAAHSFADQPPPAGRFLAQLLFLLMLIALGASFISFIVMLLYFGRSLHDYVAGTVIHEPGPARGTGFDVLVVGPR